MGESRGMETSPSFGQGAIRRLLRCLGASAVVVALVGGCGAQADHNTGATAQPAVSTTSTAVSIPQADHDPDPTAAAASRQCREYGEKLKAAQRRLAKLRRQGPPPPVDGYDFSDDYAQSVAIVESEVDFYGSLLNEECSGEPQYAQPDEPNYDPEAPLDPEPDYGP
jgi:hypothetical protein